MSRINPVDRNTTTDGVRRNFDAIQKRLGMVPNMMQTMAQSPHVLEGYLGLSGALSRGALSAQLQEQIALAVSEVNACDYCLSAHSALGRGAGLSNDELDASRTGRSATRRPPPRCSSPERSSSVVAASVTTILIAFAQRVFPMLRSLRSSRTSR